MMRYLYILCAYTFLLTSCSYHFELDEVAELPKLVMYCYPGSSDTSVVRLYQSLPVSQNGDLGYGLKDADVQVWINNEAYKMLWAEDSLPGVPAHSYYFIKKLMDGEHVRVTAKSGKLKAESSNTKIPSPFPLNSIEMIRKQDDHSKIQFRINFTDNAVDKNWYAIRVVQKQMIWSNEGYSETISAIKFELDDEPLLQSASGLDDILMIENEYYKNLYFWNDEKIQGKEYTLQLNTIYRNDYEDDFVTPDGNEHIKCNYKYKVFIYSISEEFYRYLKSLNELKNNGLGNSELAPIRSTYTNIKDGLGVVGGCRIYQTHWINNIYEN